ncbi:uncharacterized protein LOC114269815 [Camellia sinensis]|uniref:uncharacterized protein LOC114269815 n=1 Tax=Camellia sinensis TaxID=4442 RepID=UPI001035BB50|nr:uncharacterized protein LOC114269815 [Camellia sinensis]
MYFDEAANEYGCGIGVLLIAPDDFHIPLAFKLRFKVFNNKAEYEACIIGLEVALELGTIQFEKLTFTYLLRENNRFLDALATLSSMVDIPLRVKMHLIIIEQKYTSAYKTIAAIDKVQDKNPWYYDIWNFLEKDAYPPGANAKDKRGIRRLVVLFIICGNKLWQKDQLQDRVVVVKVVMDSYDLLNLRLYILRIDSVHVK